MTEVTDADRAREIADKIRCTPSVTSVEDRMALWTRLIASALAAVREEERRRCAGIASRTVCSIPPVPHTPGVRCGCDTANEIAAAILSGTPAPADEDRETPPRRTLVEEICVAINRASAENDSDTPDFVLAEYLMGCLRTFAAATRARDEWHKFKPWARVSAVAAAAKEVR